MKLIDDIIDYVEYQHINIKIHDGNVTNLSLIIYKGKFSAIAYENTSCHG